MSFQDKVMSMFVSMESSGDLCCTHGGPRLEGSTKAGHLQDHSVSMGHGHS